MMNVTNGKYATVLVLSLCVLIGQAAAKEPDVDVTLGVTMNRAICVQGEDTWVKVSFTTMSARNVVLTSPEMVDGTSFLYFEVKNNAGSVLKYRGPMLLIELEKVTISNSQPLHRYVNLRWAYDLATPGTYTVRAIFRDAIAKFTVASSEIIIKIKKVDSVRIVSSINVSKHSIYELVIAKSGKDELYLLRNFIGTGKKRWPGSCVRIKVDKESAKHASIVQVVNGKKSRGEKYRGMKIAMGDRVMVVNIQRGGPQVFTRTVNRRANDVELKLARNKKYMLVGRDGKEFHVLEPASKPATRPISCPVRSKDSRAATQLR